MANYLPYADDSIFFLALSGMRSLATSSCLQSRMGDHSPRFME
jgi:hypothetical protein